MGSDVAAWSLSCKRPAKQVPSLLCLEAAPEHRQRQGRREAAGSAPLLASPCSTLLTMEGGLREAW
jgi:hypothetical protein